MTKSKTYQDGLRVLRVAVGLLGWLANWIVTTSFAQEASLLEGKLSSARPIDMKVQSLAGDDNRIAELIQQLGSDSYATRQRAQGELAKLGLLAFDQLRDATFHSDAQIAATARYLIQSVDVAWSWETDSLAVRHILENYGVITQSDRARRILQLSDLAQDEGLAALCRLARYEARGDLSRRAALCILQSDAIDEPRIKSARVATIRQIVNSAGTDVCHWLMRYADELESNRFDTPWWSDWLDREHQLIVDRSRETSRQVTVEFSRWVAEHAAKVGDRTRALAIAERSVDLIPPNSDRVLDFCFWAIDHHLPELVIPAVAKQPQLVTGNPRIGYAIAESLIQSQNQDRARIIADWTFNRTLTNASLNSQLGLEWPVGKDESAAMPNATPAESKSIADDLRERSMFKWSEREYARALDGYAESIKVFEPNVFLFMNTAFSFSDMLQDGQEYEKAADVWQPFVTRVEEDPEFRKQINAIGQNELSEEVESILGQYYYFRAKAALHRNDTIDAQLQLVKALEADPLNSDVLIVMHRLEADAQWKAKSSAQIDQAIMRYHQLIQSSELKLSKSNPNLIPSENRKLAMSLNQLAWLLGNIERDTSEAVKMAERAVEIAPNPAHIDTLGRCYFANSQFEKAVQTQRRAVGLETWSRQMQRQLVLFEQRLAAANEKLEK